MEKLIIYLLNNNRHPVHSFYTHKYTTQYRDDAILRSRIKQNRLCHIEGFPGVHEDNINNFDKYATARRSECYATTAFRACDNDLLLQIYSTVSVHIISTVIA